eukprot:1812645-Pleurochrysis_carterae.AAC.1
MVVAGDNAQRGLAAAAGRDCTAALMSVLDALGKQGEAEEEAGAHRLRTVLGVVTGAAAWVALAAGALAMTRPTRSTQPLTLAVPRARGAPGLAGASHAPSPVGRDGGVGGRGCGGGVPFLAANPAAHGGAQRDEVGERSSRQRGTRTELRIRPGGNGRDRLRTGGAAARRLRSATGAAPARGPAAGRAAPAGHGRVGDGPGDAPAGGGGSWGARRV